MRQFSLVAVATAGSTPCAAARGRTGLLLDIGMTAVMLGLTSVFVGVLALSMS